MRGHQVVGSILTSRANTSVCGGVHYYCVVDKQNIGHIDHKHSAMLWVKRREMGCFAMLNKLWGQ